MKKKKTNMVIKQLSVSTILSIIIILFLIYSIFINPVFGQSIIDKARTNLDFEGRESAVDYDPPLNPSFHCFLDFDKHDISCGETITGTIYGGEFATCNVFVNKDSEGWVYWNSGDTGGDGYVTQTGVINEQGVYQVRAICNDECITDLETVRVTCDVPEDDLTLCSAINIPSSVGDKGGYCRDYGYCEDEECTCSHYWDYTNGVHECGCTETFYCGQYCYEYLYTSGCECPPGSIEELVTRSTYQCVPDGHYCFEGRPYEDVGPFPE